MVSHRDKPFYNIHKKCLNCVAYMETKLRSEGKWKTYENNIHNDVIDHLIGEFKMWVNDDLKDQNKSYITEAGDLEKWIGGLNKEKKEQYLQETINYLKNLKR